MNAAGISPFFVKYIAIWTSFCLVALLILAWDRKRLLPEWRLTDDETWDWVTGSGMAILTFLTAPWVVGLIYQVLTRRRPLRYLVVTLALLLFSGSWLYDGYLLWRDGAYTQRWAGNLMLSPFIYVAAGMLWNLEAKPSAGLHDDSGFQLSFVREDWPSRPVDTRFGPISFVSIPLILIATFVLVAFVNWQGLL